MLEKSENDGYDENEKLTPLDLNHLERLFAKLDETLNIFEKLVL